MSAVAIAVGSFELEVPLDVAAPEAEEEDAYAVVQGLLGSPELFRSHEGAAHVTFDDKKRRRSMRIDTDSFRHVVRARFRRATGKMLSSKVLAEVIEHMVSNAIVDGPQFEIHRRIAHHDGAILLDLADGTGRVVRITDLTWDVTQVPGVRFIEDQRCKALPEPVRGGSIMELRPFVNVATDDAFFLFVGFMLTVFRPKPPYMVLLVNGAQGSAKSTLTRMVRRILDPGMPEIRPLTDKPEDILIGARFARILAFDNLSGISAKAADTICSLVTGAGFGTRKFFTNLDEVYTEVSASVVLNGIDGLAERGDLADRAVHLELERIPDTKRRDEASFWAAFEEARPRILGALCDAVSMALRRLPTLKLPRAPRMADAALWMSAAEPSLGLPDGTFLDLLEKNRASALTATAEADPVALAVFELAKVMGLPSKEYTATSLLSDLDARRKCLPPDRYWPKTPGRLSSRLARAIPALSHLGVEVERGIRASTKKGERLIRITYRSPFSGPPSVGGVSNVVPFAPFAGAKADDGSDASSSAPSADPSAEVLSGDGDADDADAADGMKVRP